MTWSAGAGWWFVEVTPKRPAAAPMSFAVMDESGIYVTVGNTYFETYGPVEESLQTLKSFIAAVFAGRVEEAGTSNDGFAWVGEGDDLWRVGNAHLPIPRRWRRTRRYLPYILDR